MATISAVIATYNRKPYVERAILSILAQSIQPVEIVVVDDGSTDGTADALEATFGAALRIIRKPNGGVSSARAVGVEAATGDWVAFLDSDDEWRPGRMRAFTEAIATLPSDVAWIFGDTIIVRDDDASSLFATYNFEELSERRVFNDATSTQYPFQFSLLQSSVIRRSAIMRAGNFSEGLTSSEDFLLGFRLSLHNRFAAIPEAVTNLYRTSDLAASSLDSAGRRSPDYHRARAIAFREAIEALGSGPWAKPHAEAARNYCVALAAQEGRLEREFLSTADRSLRSILFRFAAAFGVRGLQAWAKLSALRGHKPVARSAIIHAG